MKVRKAVIPAAGFGTRFLPASKAVPKELIPVVDRPVIQYSVEELVRAGITDIYVVISPGKESVTDHFRENSRLESALKIAGKLKLLQEVLDLQGMATITPVQQTEPLGLGHAVWVTRDQIKDEPFVVLLPDEIFDPRRNFVGEMIEAFDQHATSVVAVTKVPHEAIGSYGAIATAQPEASVMAVTGVVEKPDPAEAPSDLALCGRYVLHPEVFDILEGLDPGAGGEIQLADALGVMAGQDRLWANRYDGRRWDVGNKQGYLEAVVTLALDDPELGPAFGRFLSRMPQRG